MTEIISLILGAVLPPFIDFLTKSIADSKVRFFISLGVCVLAGGVINFDSFNGQDILASIALVFGSAQIVYKTYWKESNFRADANKGQD